MNVHENNEGLKLARLMMVLSSLSPLFLLWAIRGAKNIDDAYLWGGCGALIIFPNLVLLLRLTLAKKRRDHKTITVGQADDHREHLLVYLFAMLIPLYDANLGSSRDTAATILAFIFIVFLFWHLNLHYMNVLFALFGYRVFTITSLNSESGGKDPFVLLTQRSHLQEGNTIHTYRISNTVFIELKEANEF